MRNIVLLCVLSAALSSMLISLGYGGETVDTIAIREVFEKETTGWKRADVKLATSVYAPYFTGYEGYWSADPRNWRVSFRNLEEFRGDLREKVSRTKYDVSRIPLYFNIVGDKAIVVTEEIGSETHRETEEKSEFSHQNLWMLAKIDEKWKITSFVAHISEDTLGTSEQSRPAREGEVGLPTLKDVLEEETEGWKKGDVDMILSLYADYFTGYEGYENSDPQKWQVNFKNLDEFKVYLKRRLSKTKYDISRRPVYFNILGDKALVVTEETGSTTHREMEKKREFERHNLWTLAKVGDRWKITGFVHRIALPED